MKTEVLVNLETLKGKTIKDVIKLSDGFEFHFTDGTNIEIYYTHGEEDLYVILEMFGYTK